MLENKGKSYMNNLKIGTKVRIKSKEEIMKILDKEYVKEKAPGDNSICEWRKKIAKEGTIIFLDPMFKNCGKECTTSSKFTGLGYYMNEVTCYWNPDWFNVIEEPQIVVGDTVVLNTMAEAAEDKETLEGNICTFGELTYEDMWGKEYKVEAIAGNKIRIRKNDYKSLWVSNVWVSKIISAEDIYRRNIEEYVSNHNFNESLPDEHAPYDWSIVIDKNHRFMMATVSVDSLEFIVQRNPLGEYRVVKVD